MAKTDKNQKITRMTQSGSGQQGALGALTHLEKKLTRHRLADNMHLRLNFNPKKLLSFKVKF